MMYRTTCHRHGRSVTDVGVAKACLGVDCRAQHTVHAFRSPILPAHIFISLSKTYFILRRSLLKWPRKEVILSSRLS